MPRTTKAHKAGLDLLDQIVFNELVVYQGMTDYERLQLDTIISRVTEMAETKYVGSEIEFIKHLAFALLGVALCNTIDECQAAFPVIPQATNVTLEEINKVEKHHKKYVMQKVLDHTGEWMGLDGDYALKIVDELRSEFTGYSALVRRDLLMRCFVAEFSDASVKTYCWLISCGVLPVTKNGPDRIKWLMDENIAMRLALICDYEMIAHQINISSHGYYPPETRIAQDKLELHEQVNDRLLDVEIAHRRSAGQRSLKGFIPLIGDVDMFNQERIKEFFRNWGERKARFRMYSGNLASWLGFLGAVMVKKDHVVEQKKQELEDSRAKDTGEIAKRVMQGIYSDTDNAGKITENVQSRLADLYGLRISANTLYRAYDDRLFLSNDHLLENYCRLSRDLDVAFPAIGEDNLYQGSFMLAGKFIRKR